jgi:hypothetical protein
MPRSLTYDLSVQIIVPLDDEDEPPSAADKRHMEKQVIKCLEQHLRWIMPSVDAEVMETTINEGENNADRISQ